MTVFKEWRLLVASGMGSLQIALKLIGGLETAVPLGLAPQNDEDAGEKRDNSWNDAKIESENSDEADKNQIDRE
jgi:hypothetical protein